MKVKKEKKLRKNIFRTNKILRKCMPGIRVKLAVLTGIFVSFILAAATFFNYVHEGRILEEGLIRETESSLKLISSVIVDMENVRNNILLIEDMRLRIEEKKRDLVQFKKIVYRKNQTVSNSFRSLGQKLGMKVKYEYYPVLVDSYYSVYLKESDIKTVEKGVMAQLKGKDGQAVNEKEFASLQSKAKSLVEINKNIEFATQSMIDYQQKIDELTSSDSADKKETSDVQTLRKEIKTNEKNLVALNKKRLNADRVFRNQLKQYFEYEFSKMEQAGLQSGDIRIKSSDRQGEVVYDTGSRIRDGLVRFSGLLAAEKYIRERTEFFSMADNSLTVQDFSDYDYRIGQRAFHVKYLPAYRNPATYERMNIILSEIEKNPSRWNEYLKKDAEVAASIAEVVEKMKDRIAILKDKKIPPNADAEYQSLYKKYRQLADEREKGFEKLNPYKNEKSSIAEYYNAEIKKANNDLAVAVKKISEIKAGLVKNKNQKDTDNDLELLQANVDELKDRIAVLKNDFEKSSEDISLSEKLSAQDAFHYLRNAALYDFIVLKLGNQPFVFHDYRAHSRSRLVESKRWNVVRNWIYSGKSETEIPEVIPDMRNIKTIDNGILSYSRGEAEEYMWKLDSTPLVTLGAFGARIDSSALIGELLASSVTGYNEVIVDKTNGLDKIKNNRKAMLMYSGIIVILSIILAYLFAGFIVRRIHGIVDQAKRAGSGDLDVAFPEKGIDEIEEMAISLNAMMHGLREREELKGEISAAAVIQKQLLPETIPSNLDEDYSIGKFYRPMRGVGGDYYDFLQLDKTRMLFCIGDVSSHGVGPAMVMAILRAHLHGIVKRGERDLVKILIDLNQQIFSETPSYIFVTFFIGIIDGTTHEIEYCSAGHMKPMVYRYKKEDIEILDGGGIPIGMDDQDFFTDTIKTAKVQMKPGDVFFQYTDGVNEAMNDNRELYGGDRLIANLKKNAKKKPDIMINQIAQSVESFTGKDLVSATGMTDYNDDVAMIVIKRLR
jgi:phosphoserine phosphatase RsbU/P